ncbi:hypothetical protein PUNSTDRAFT_119214 [Punctularia strigosozonata HHB-11173 SS5]|uniref:uncharacterized protein n=1 Tax=Punctularia strigosozonata (strain HHB-11173) TaxID=741275 RepID=UPI00044183A2|nr:uncharacterized protein PUNSTDRAFT_119214 [Punctularia strigosozonata HHB-11173 SS5]EIN12079.1 hypothetical protein PUNSTDRAFT_119214 [Punctularia strigosozonata HHB-11173 SS5]
MVGFLSPESAHSPLPAVPEPSDPNYLAEDNVAPFIPPAPGTGSESYAMPSTAGPPSYAAPPVGVPYPGSSSSGSAPYVPSGSAPQPQPMFGGLPPGFMPTGLPAGFVPMAPPLSAEQYAQTPGAVPVQIAPQPPITVGNAMVNQPRTANAPSRPPSAPVIPRAPSVPSVMRVDPGAGAPMPGSFEIEPATSGMPSNPSNSAPVPAPAPTAMPVPAPSVVPVPPPGVYSDRSRGSARRAPVNIYGGRGTPAIQTELSRNIPTPESSEPDDEISSSLGSLDTLTTPPQRPKHMAGATPRYEEAPLPSGVSYPQPGRPASSRSARTRTSSGGTTSSATAAAARVPLPPSTVGWSPRTASSPYGSSWGTISTNMNAGATPAPLNRPFSIFSDAPKGGGDRDSLRGSRFGSDAGSEFNDDLLVRSNNHNPIPVPPPGVVTRAPSGSASVRERIERLGTILDSPHQTKRKPQGRYAASVESVSDD